MTNTTVYDSVELHGSEIRDSSPVTPEELSVRKDLAAAYRLCALFGWDDLIYSHISARVPNTEDQFLVNPLGLGFDEITASSLVKIDLKGRVIGPNEYKPNAAGFVIHGAIHSAREDVHCIMHLHTDAGMALSMLREGLQPLTQHAMRFHNRVGYHDYEGIALTEEEKQRFIDDMADNTALILRNHGTITVGSSVAQAFVESYYLEKSARAQLLAYATGRELTEPSPGVIQLTAEQWIRSVGVSNGREWPSLIRKLDKMDASYKD
jgi:ribulose-5-phosphate 4-epimerase/fuculose-1-phosphate aldolase